MIGDAAANDFPRWVDDLKDSAGGDTFAAAAFADDAERFAALNGVADAIDGFDHAFVGEKVEFKVTHVEQGV